MATITMDTPKLRRALSTNTGKQVMADVSEVASRVFRESELPRLGFEVGVVNTLVKAMVFAGAPQFQAIAIGHNRIHALARGDDFQLTDQQQMFHGRR